MKTSLRPPRVGLFSRSASAASSVKAAIAAIAAIAALGGCAGDASDGEAPTIEFSNSTQCIRFDGSFPSDFELLPGRGDEAVVMRVNPIRALGLDLDREPPSLLARDGIPDLPRVACSACSGLVRVDSDADGVADACRSDELGWGCQSPFAGDLLALDASRIALSTSAYEQILFLDPRTNLQQPVLLATPEASPDFDPLDWPFWPAPGEDALTSALSTRACIFEDTLSDAQGDPIVLFDSNGGRLTAAGSCDPAGIRIGFATGFTAGSARVADRLFVATSNLLRSTTAQFAPATLLVFDYDDSISPPRASPHRERGALVFGGYNTTSVTPYRTPTGRDLVLVGSTGALALGSGSNLVRSDSSIEVVDADSLDWIATIPLGRAGLGFDALAIDPSGRIALAGAATKRALFGIDLAALDDPMLGHGPEPLPRILDGSDPGVPDARLFTASDPFVLPTRSDDPAPSDCASQIAVDLAEQGDWGIASDSCDGTLSVLALALPAARATTLDPASVVRVERVQNVGAPLGDDVSDRPRAIDRVRIRPGDPGLDFAGPDAYFSAIQGGEGAVCGARIRALD